MVCGDVVCGGCDDDVVVDGLPCPSPQVHEQGGGSVIVGRLVKTRLVGKRITMWASSLFTRVTSSKSSDSEWFYL